MNAENNKDPHSYVGMMYTCARTGKTSRGFAVLSENDETRDD